MKIKVDNTTYIFLFISFLAGYFEYMYLLLLIVFIHESGHYIFSKIVGFKYSEIIIYPFGGVTIHNEDLNISIQKELFSLLGGIVFQLLFFIICFFLYKNLFITNHVYLIIKRINILLISFNFLPIIPLDGGRLVNIVLDNVFSYKKSFEISLIISIVFTFIFLSFKITVISLSLSIFIVKSIYFEYKNSKYRFNKFILERYLNNYNFKKIKKVKNINLFKRDNKHIINNEFESVYLSKLFDRNL